jgi:F0F1-type ATP synthase assembly protein I
MSAKIALTNKDSTEVQRAKAAFLVGLLDISWRLATVFMVPVIVGVVVDQANNSDKFTVVGVVVGIILSVLFIIKQGLDANKTKAGKS